MIKIFKTIKDVVPEFIVQTIDELRNLLNSKENVDRIASIRERFQQGEDVSSEKLNCMNFIPDGVLQNDLPFSKANIVACEHVVLDIDHISDDSLTNNLIDALIHHRAEWKLLFVAPGVRHVKGNGSIHVVAQKQVDCTEVGSEWIKIQQDALLNKICAVVGEDIRTYHDKNVAHFGRRLFLTTFDDIIYINKGFIESFEIRENPFLNSTTQSSIVGVQSQNQTLIPKEATYRGVRLCELAEHWMMQEYGNLEAKGEAHAALVKITGILTALTVDSSELYGAVQNICTQHDEQDKIRVSMDAPKYRRSFVAKWIDEYVKGKGSTNSTQTTDSQNDKTTNSPNDQSMSSDDTHKLLTGGNQPLPQQLTSGIKNLLSCVPAPHKKAAICLAYGDLQVYCSNLSVYGLDGRAMPISFGTCAVGGPATGKSSVFNHIKKPVLGRQIARDEANMQAFEAWQQQKVQTNSQSKLAQQPPQAQQIFSNASRIAIAKNMKESGKQSIVIDDELSGLMKYEKNAYSSLSELLRYGFDHAEIRNSSGAVGSFQGTVVCRLGSVLCAQPQFLSFFDVNNGFATRQWFCIMNQSVSVEIPQYTAYSAANIQAIDDMIDKLEAYNGGIITLRKCSEMLKNWQNGFAQEYIDATNNGMNPSYTLCLLSRRCASIALKVAAMTYVAEGCVENSAVLSICKYVANESLYNLYLLFNKEFSAANPLVNTIEQNKKQFKRENTDRIILSHLSDTADITMDDIKAAMKSAGLDPSDANASNRITYLCKSGYLKRKCKGIWTKQIKN